MLDEAAADSDDELQDAARGRGLGLAALVAARLHQRVSGRLSGRPLPDTQSDIRTQHGLNQPNTGGLGDTRGERGDTCSSQICKISTCT